MDGQAKSIYYTKKAALEKDDRSIELQVNEGRDILSVLSMSLDRDVIRSTDTMSSSESEPRGIGRGQIARRRSYCPDLVSSSSSFAWEF